MLEIGEEEKKKDFRPDSPKTPPPEIRSWDDMNLKPDLLRGIYSYGFETPSEIQKKAILPMVHNHDIIAQAQSGSGKTGSFTIGVLQSIDVSKPFTQAIILAPTHELAKQITNVIKSLGSMMDGLTIKTLVGGTSIREDAREMQNSPPHIVIGCVGRVFDMLSRKHIMTSDLKWLVLDEADEMLSSGFGDKIRDMFRFFFDESIQVALFSATMPPEMLALTKRFMREPVEIVLKPEELNLKCIQQFFVAVPNDYSKFETLKDLFSIISVSKCIIYCNNVKRVHELYEAMMKDDFSVCCIHSNMDKSERDKVFTQFRYGDHRVLISSDLTARGIDIQQVSTVINYDVPTCVNTYLHRIGRSGRWGRKGFAINFVTRHDIQLLHNIEKHYDMSIQELPANFSCIV